MDTKNQLHLTWRDLLPSEKPGEIGNRDISHAVSTDMGKTFSAPQPVAADGWKVNACPHTGPVVTQAGDEVLATWFSGKEDEIGLRIADINTGKRLTQRLSVRARHPQITTQNDRLLWVWDESFQTGTNPEGGPMYTQKICLQAFMRNKPGEVSYLSPETAQASYPAILTTKTGVMVAYEERKTLTDNAVIVCKWIDAL